MAGTTAGAPASAGCPPSDTVTDDSPRAANSSPAEDRAEVIEAQSARDSEVDDRATGDRRQDVELRRRGFWMPLPLAPEAIEGPLEKGLDPLILHLSLQLANDPRPLLVDRHEILDRQRGVIADLALLRMLDPSHQQTKRLAVGLPALGDQADGAQQ